MESQHPTEELLNFFNALADANRLKIVGLLAEKPYSVEELAVLRGRAHLDGERGVGREKIQDSPYFYIRST